ncbi:hypothetical protein M3D48_03065 [Dermabacter vaginalis]|uniref:hypothetical protein n=1 Tax=Dermabacter vaginalis TaxID=1630135 RepID=UPI0021A493C8|nr:hypothetical protein [Dermabacter vaginalis]MCT2149606.1 hypothetical protein [Dermabacter vaginalis]
MSAQLAPSANFVKHHAGQGGRNAVYAVLKHAMRDERGVGTHGNENVDDARISWNRNFVFDEESGGLIPGDYDDAMQRYFDVFGAESREKEEKRFIEAEKRKYRRAKKRAVERGEDVPPEPDFSKIKLEQPRYPHKPSKGPGKVSARTNSATVSAVTWVLHPSVENGWFEETFPKWKEDEEEREAVERMLMDYYESLMEALQMEERSVLGVSLNMDETTPHVHVVLASVDFDERDKAIPNWQRIGGGNRVEGPAKLEKVHDDYRAALRERGYDVTDVRVSEKGNVPGPRYGAMKDRAREDAKKELEAEERSLERWRQDLQEWADDTEKGHAAQKKGLAEDRESLEAEKVVVAKDREANQQQAQDLDRREKAVAEREKAATEREKAVAEREEAAAEREEINAMNKQSNDEWGMNLFNSIQDLKQVKDRLTKEDAEKIETATGRVRDYRAGKPAPKKKAPQKRRPGSAPQKQADDGDYGYC